MEMAKIMMKLGMKKLSKKIAPPEPIHSGKRTGAIESFKLNENI